MKCSGCDSGRVMEISGKVSDRCIVGFKGAERDGYPPTVDDICGGDDINVDICLECGLVQGEFPKPDPEMG